MNQKLVMDTIDSGEEGNENSLFYNLRTMKPGAKIKVLKMDTAGGMDWQAKRLEGKIFTVRFIDSAGQIHLKETGLALIPGVDQYEVVG